MPRKADPEARRAEVVAAAFRLLDRQGIEGFSMRAVAAEAGCTIGLINRWFESKDDLVTAAMEVAASSVVERCFATLRDPTGTIEKAISEFLPLDEARTSEKRVWVAFSALALGRPEIRERHVSRYRELRRQLKREARAHGASAEESTRITDVLIALIDGIILNAVLDPDHWKPSRQLRSLRWAIRAIGSEVE